MKLQHAVIRILTVCLVMAFILGSFTRSAFAYTYRAGLDWNEYKSDHFIIYYHSSIPGKYIREFTKTCERYYYLIAQRLGFRRFDFWSWQSRGRIFIYESREEYVTNVGRPHWSAASVQIKKRTISTYYFAKDFFNTILPHELTHIILREFIGSGSNVPLWFEEGTACANEDKCYLKYLLPAKSLVNKKTYVPVGQIESLGAAGVRHPSIFYPIAASLVIFLLEEYGKDDFVRLCREIRDGDAFYRAMDDVYNIRNAQDLNEKFLSFLEGKSYDDIVANQELAVDW